jgi:hypothetical protein
MDSFMACNNIPGLGDLQSTLGHFQHLAFKAMAKNTRARKYVGVITRRIVADNLRVALLRRYGDQKNHTGLLKKEFGFTPSQTQRVLDGSLGVSIDWIEEICVALEMTVHEMFLPTAEMQRQMKVPEQAPNTNSDLLLHRGSHSNVGQATPARGNRITK